MLYFNEALHLVKRELAMIVSESKTEIINVLNDSVVFISPVQAFGNS